METLIIQVICESHSKDAKPQLGITVEAPYSVRQQQQQQQLLLQQARDYRNHDYQNFETPNEVKNKTSTKHNSNYQNLDALAYLRTNHCNNSNTGNILSNVNGKHNVNYLSEQIQRGLQITHIQEGSVIDKNGHFRLGDIIVEVNGVNLERRSFQEAQKTLREFVVKHSSHAPLLLKVLRKSASSSSLPSTTGSQATIIESRRDSRNASPSLTTTVTPKKSASSLSSLSPQSSSSARHFVGALNTRRMGAKHCIRLTKSQDGGFGIKIAERDNMFGTNRPIYITAITTTGSAYRDGRLREGDMLLEINGIDLSDKSQPDVTKMLKAVPVNESVEFVVSRQENLRIEDLQQVQPDNSVTTLPLENGCDNNGSLIDLDKPNSDGFASADSNNHQFEKKIDSLLNVPTIDGPGDYIYDIPLNDTKSAGLGLYLKYPTLPSNSDKPRRDLGIWIEKVITGGAAWKDGRLQRNDQILAINGITLTKMSNTKASETLTAAVCRGMGPEATSSNIRLHIRRRNPEDVNKKLHGSNNRIEHSDLPVNGHNKLYGSYWDRNINNTQDSYKTALDSTIHSRSQSSNDTSASTKSSNQNSHNDSAMSPQTQASNSLKLSSSCNEKSDQNFKDETNDTSSAISQITDFTNVSIVDGNSPEKDSSNSDNQAAFTLPKTLELSDEDRNIDPASSIQSWDDENVDAENGVDNFQRDGFGRQSISEKRHAQLMAKNTDTYRRSLKLRKEREKQRQFDEQLGQMHSLQAQNQLHHLHQQPIVQAKLTQNVMNRPRPNMMNMHQNQQFSDHHQSLPPPPPTSNPQHIHHMLPMDLQNQRIHFNQSPVRHQMIHNSHMSMSNGSQSTNQWRSPVHHAPNGLWVTNSPVVENQIRHCSIYGTQPMATYMRNQSRQVPPLSLAHPTPSIPSIGQNSNGAMHQSSLLQNHISTLNTPHAMHNLRPQNTLHHLHQQPIVQAKLTQNVMNRPRPNMMNMHQNQQFSDHHQSLPPPPPTSNPQHIHHMLPMDLQNQRIHFNQSPVRHQMIHNSHMSMSNGSQSTNQWRSPVHHAPNGLWVTNSPMVENQIRPCSIYGTQPMATYVRNQSRQAPPLSLTHPTPSIGLNSNGARHQSSLLQNHISTLTPQHLHNQQLQHIYYYDF